MSNRYEMNDKRWGDITRIIKVISESVKGFFNQAKKDGTAPDRDTPLVAMQVLAILCGLARGYTKEQIDQLWKTSLETAGSIHESRRQDRTQAKLQLPVGFEESRKN